MPSAGRQPAKQRAFRSLVAKMKGLRIELGRKGLDLVRGYRMRAAGKSAADRKVIQKKPIRRAFAVDFGPRNLQAAV
jgi:hypothetical protein